MAVKKEITELDPEILAGAEAGFISRYDPELVESIVKEAGIQTAFLSHLGLDLYIEAAKITMDSKARKRVEQAEAEGARNHQIGEQFLSSLRGK